MKLFFIGILFSIMIAVPASAQTASADFERGMIATAKGNYDKALKDFRKALDAARTEDVGDRVRSRIHFNAGVCLYRLGEFEAAVTEFERALRLDQKYEKASYSLGMAFAELGEWKSAESAFQAALRENSRNGETWFDLAYAHLELGNTRGAERAFRNAIRFGGGDGSVSHNNLGVIYAVAGRTDEAISEFETAIRLSNGSLAAALENLWFCKSNAVAGKDRFQFAARPRETDKQGDK